METLAMPPYVLRSRCVLTLIALALSAGAAHATAFNDAANGDWNSSATWSPAGVPGAGDSVTIDSNTVRGIGGHNT